jgi:hypothetical protein
MPVSYASGIWAMEDYFKSSNGAVAGKIKALRTFLEEEFGLASKLAAPVGGRLVRHLIRREEKRLQSGWTYQPSAFIEKRNWAQVQGNLEFPVLRPVAETE